MLREDYDRFLKIAEKEIDKENFFLQTTETEEGCYDYEIARIRLNDTHFVQHHRKNISLHDGFFSEIIPYDDLPDSNLRSFFYEKYFKYMKKILGIRKGYRYQIENPLKEKLFYFITSLTKIIPFSILDKKMRNYHLGYQNKNSKRVFLYNDPQFLEGRQP